MTLLCFVAVSEEFTSSSSTTAFSESTSSSPMCNRRVEKRNASHAFGDEAWPPPSKKSKGIDYDNNLPVIIVRRSCLSFNKR
jgi:hypothetical protein